MLLNNQRFGTFDSSLKENLFCDFFSVPNGGASGAILIACLLPSVSKMFILVLAFACFSKSMTATHMKSSITQIERHFDISTTHVGLIDGSFEMGTFRPPSRPRVWVRPSDLLPCLLGDRQPVVSGPDQPLRGAAAPTQDHFRRMFDHGLGGAPHRPDSLLHGTVNISNARFCRLMDNKKI